MLDIRLCMLTIFGRFDNVNIFEYVIIPELTIFIFKVFRLDDSLILLEFFNKLNNQ